MTDGNPAREAGFDAAPDRALQQEGVRGRLWTWAEGPTLHLEGRDGGAVDIPASLVDRLRFGRAPTHSSGLAWRVLIWRKGLDHPLYLTSLDRRFGPAMRGFAGQVAAGGTGRIERGASPRLLYLAFPAMVLACAGMTAGGAYEALRGGAPWYWAFALAMAVVTLLCAARSIRTGPGRSAISPNSTPSSRAVRLTV